MLNKSPNLEYPNIPLGGFPKVMGGTPKSSKSWTTISAESRLGDKITGETNPNNHWIGFAGKILSGNHGVYITIYQTGGFLYLFPRGAGNRLWRSRDADYAAEGAAVVKRQRKKPTKRGLGEDVIYVYWHFDIATTIDNWTLHHYVYDLYLERYIYIYIVWTYTVCIYIYERER